jgi:uncharacterized protein (TIGR02145 family)
MLTTLQMVQLYGKLYNWYAVNDPRGLAPEGYHIPTQSEWLTLINCAGGLSIAGSELKQTGTTYWNPPNSDATNSTNFTALGAGARGTTTGNPLGLKVLGSFWTSDEQDSLNAISYSVNYLDPIVALSNTSKKRGLSVRLIQDPTPTPTPTETPTPTVTDSPTPTPTPTITDSPTPTPTPTVTPTSAPPPFISIWRTTSSSETIYLPLESGGTYSFNVNWGDGNIETITSYLTNSHEYAVAGDYTVTINGTIEGWNFQTLNTSRNNIIEITQWGSLKLGNNGGYFKDATNLVLTGVTDTLNLVGVTDMSLMFFGCSSITTVNNMNSWDVSNVTSLFQMFYNAVLFNQDISNWDVSNVPDMSYTFQNAISFNQPLNNWNVSGVTNMQYMFVSAGGV